MPEVEGSGRIDVQVKCRRDREPTKEVLRVTWPSQPLRGLVVQPSRQCYRKTGETCGSLFIVPVGLTLQLTSRTFSSSNNLKPVTNPN